MTIRADAFSEEIRDSDFSVGTAYIINTRSGHYRHFLGKLLALFSTINSLPVPRAVLLLSLVATTDIFTTFPTRSHECLLNGDDDVYGIEICLNLYFQWPALLVATRGSLEAARFARSVANIITIAVLANTFRASQIGSVIVLE